MTLTADEKTFLNRAAFHVANGMDIGSALRAVLDDDFRIACAFGTFRPALQRRTPAQQELVSAVADSVYHTIRAGA